MAKYVLSQTEQSNNGSHRKPHMLPIYLSDAELDSLLGAVDRTSRQGRRDYAILATLAHTGIRLRELTQLDISDVDFREGELRVLGKGSRERLIPMNSIVVAALGDHLAWRPTLCRDDAIFLNRFGRRLSGRMVENIVRKYVRRAKIGKAKMSPHKLRHTFATLLYMRGADLLEIQALLGHVSISTTQIYTHTSARRLRSAVARLE